MESLLLAGVLLRFSLPGLLGIDPFADLEPGKTIMYCALHLGPGDSMHAMGMRRRSFTAVRARDVRRAG